MGRRPKTMTLAQHKRYGFFLKLFEAGLTNLVCILCRTYGKTSSVTLKAEKAERAISALKCHLDDLVCSETPRTYLDAIHIYYSLGQPWADNSDAVLDAIQALAPKEVSQTDSEHFLQRLLDAVGQGHHLTEAELLRIWEIQKVIDLILKYQGIDRKQFEWLVRREHIGRAR